MSRQSAHEGGKVVSSNTGRHYSPEDTPVIYFVLHCRIVLLQVLSGSLCHVHVSLRYYLVTFYELHLLCLIS